MRNHINALKKQEIELNKKAEQAKEKEMTKNKIKQEKDHLKQVLLSSEINKRNALEEKKKFILQNKIKNDMQMKKLQEKTRKEKVNKYKQAKKDMKIAEEKMLEKNNKNNQIIHNNIEKIREEREKMRARSVQRRHIDNIRMNETYKNYEDNINETQKLKDELNKLESMEDKYMENIKKTQEFIRRNNVNEKVRLKNCRKIKYNSDSNNNYNIYYKHKIRSRSTANSARRRNKNN